MDLASLTQKKSSVYEQTRVENNMQLTELQIYINNIAGCIGIVGFISEMIQYHQLNTIIKCYTLFTSLVYTNHNNIQQPSDIHQTFRSFYKPSPIFITHYFSINPHTIRLQW